MGAAQAQGSRNRPQQRATATGLRSLAPGGLPPLPPVRAAVARPLPSDPAGRRGAGRAAAREGLRPIRAARGGR